MRSCSGPAPVLVLLIAGMARAEVLEGEPTLTLLDGRGGQVSSLTAGETLTVQIDGLEARAPHDVLLRTEDDAILGMARAAASRDGRLGPEVLWYTSGVTGLDPGGTGARARGFLDFTEAEEYLAQESLRVEVRRSAAREIGSGLLVVSFPLEVSSRTGPRLFFSDASGSYRTSFEAGLETVFVTGEGFPSGSVVRLFVVPDQRRWEPGDALHDVTGWRGRPHPVRVHLAGGERRFTVPVWHAASQRPGTFDLVARSEGAGVADSEARLLDSDLVSHGAETGLFLRAGGGAIAGVDVEAEVAGRSLRAFPHHEFLDVLLRHDTVNGALDPTDVPSGHPGGTHAAIHVVPERSRSDWRLDQSLLDVTEVVEIRPVKAGTLEIGQGSIWEDPDPPGSARIDFDVVLEFAEFDPPGPRRGTTLGSGGRTPFDGDYTPGLDLLDGWSGVGLTIIDDPSEPGPFPVGRTEYDFPDDYDIPWGTYADNNVDIRAVVAYPGASGGTDVDLPPGTDRYPLVVILHGNHSICTGSQCDHNCPPNDRIPNHWGYDYLLDLWASHGFVAVSADGFDVTCNQNRYLERGAVILEHVRRWTDWDDSTVPDPTFGGRYWDRIDLDNVGICGHSRGGEGAVAAQIINQAVGLGHQIRCVVAIAPTDQNTAPPPGGGPRSFVLDDTPFFNMMGASDGDVWTMHGARLWDRAATAGHEAIKSQAFIYGANHNSWNTVWIDSRWPYGGDDGLGGGRISATDQQLTAKVFITAWLMAWCKDRPEMLAFHRNRLEAPGLADVKTFWSYEARRHKNVDHFEDSPVDPFVNSLGGVVTADPPPEDYLESGFRAGNYDGSFYQDTSGLIVGWRQETLYESEIPPPHQDLSEYTHFHVRTSIIHDGNDKNPQGKRQRLFVNLEDVHGVQQSVSITSGAFDVIPYPYYHPLSGYKSMLHSVRIPLRSFLQDQSGLDLTQVARVVITFQDTGLLAIDDIQFTK